MIMYSVQIGTPNLVREYTRFYKNLFLVERSG